MSQCIDLSTQRATILATCGSASCVRNATCVAGTAAPANATISMYCLTGNEDCGGGGKCNAAGVCQVDFHEYYVVCFVLFIVSYFLYRFLIHLALLAILVLLVNVSFYQAITLIS